MINFNYHIHSSFSDGQAPLWHMTQKAQQLGLKHIAITDHGPLPFQNEWSISQSDRKAYIKMLDEQKELYPDMTIFRGLELDYIPDTSRDFSELKELWQLELVIGSVHLVKHPESGKLWFIDGPKENFENGLDRIFNLDIKKGVLTYFNQIQQMIKNQKPDIIGHIDKIRMNNRDRYFSDSEPWYIDKLEETLHVAKECNCIVEVNTRGYYSGKTHDLFPSDYALRLIKEYGIPVTISSDAHRPDEILAGHDEAVIRLKDSGISTIKYLTPEGWKDYSL
ncbi:MAG: histidinol-phosphatase [Bacteroidales bacterium]|nr:histidinol-phosphatase [Bacteroidales bacterium]